MKPNLQTTSLLEEMLKKKELREKIQQKQSQRAENRDSSQPDAYAHGTPEQGGRDHRDRDHLKSYNREMHDLQKRHRGGHAAPSHQVPPSSSANPPNGLEQQVGFFGPNSHDTE